MKKALIVITLLFLFTLPAMAQNYWDLNTSFQGIMALPADSNGAAFGGGLRVSFGLPDGSFDIGFETSKWWRSFELGDSLTGYLIRNGDYNDPVDSTPTVDSLLDRDQDALQFSIYSRYRYMTLFNDGLNLYSGVGGGFYFLQERREESRRNPLTGYWEIVKVDNYLETKAHTFVMLGFDGNITNRMEIYAEYRFTYVFDWDRWEDPYLHLMGIGLKYRL